MRIGKAFAASSASALVLAACVFQACGGSESGPDGGKDGNVDMPDTGNGGMDTGTGTDTGPGDDTGTDGNMMMDSGPNCTNNPCVIGLAVGGHHACALIKDGTVRCWGANTRGQIGIVNDAGFNNMNRLVPGPVDGLTGVSKVSAATVYTQIGTTCAVTANGVICLGDNNFGQMGLGSMVVQTDMNPHPTPAAVTNIMGGVTIGSNNYFSCSVTNANEYWCWGDNTGATLGRGVMPNGPAVPGKATLLADAGAISAGSPGGDFNLALTQGGVIYSWGNNQAGQLGRMTNQGTDPNPAPIGGVTMAKQMSAGETHACAVTTGGQLACWGSNNYGQLGRGNTSNGSNTPTAVPLPGNKMADQVACSNWHTCALATDGTVYCWGRNNAGQVGLNGFDAGTAYNPQPVTAPVAVSLPAKAIAIGVGGTNLGNVNTGYSCALLDGGNVFCWGYNGDGELGRSADAGGTTAGCNMQSGLPNGSTCSPVPSSVIWQ